MNKKKKFLLLLASNKSALPAGYAALEYLESSGTQYLDTGLRGCDLSSRVECRAELTTYQPSRRMFQGQGFAFASNRADFFDCFVTLPIGDNLRKNGYLPSLGYQESSYSVSVTNGDIEINGRSFTASDIQVEVSVAQNDATGETLKILAYPDGVSYQSSWWVGKLYSFSAMLQSGEVRFIPALRKADGVAGMFDAVSKRFFVNAGSGTFGYRIKGAPAAFSLRDPHRVAPSGVHARKVSETELEIVADTEETSGDGWEWFANSAEAMEHFGIIEAEQI